MITDEARALRSKFNTILDLHLQDPDDKQVVRKVRLASEELFKEIIKNCNPTEAEFSFLMNQVMMTARMIFWIIAWFVDGETQSDWVMVPDDGKGEESMNDAEALADWWEGG